MVRIFSLSLLWVLCSATSVAQTIRFELADPQPDLIEVYSGSLGSGDIDGDGDQDLLMSGLTPGRETALYLNDGNGNFTEILPIPFPEASNTVTIFKDLDADGDLDVFFAGMGFNIQEFAHIYLNDGAGAFTQLANPALPSFQDGNAAIGDVDNDGDPDIVISALDKNNNFVADVYLNDGNANFTAMASTAFTAVKAGVLAFIDVENDGDADLIISGKKADNTASTILYLNDGLGNYAADTASVFEQLAADDLDVADIDNDGDLDILTSGVKDPFVIRTILYLNDGNGQFAELATANLQQTFTGTNAIADLDNDGDQDLVILGSQMGGIPNIFNIVYENMGNNVFVPTDTIGGEYIASCVLEDFNGDNLLDIIMIGFVANTNVYWNSSTILNSVDEPIPLASVYPNPSNGSFFVESNTGQPISLQIVSINGSLIYQDDSLVGRKELALDLPSGLYFAVLRSEKISQRLKLIISK